MCVGVADNSTTLTNEELAEIFRTPCVCCKSVLRLFEEQCDEEEAKPVSEGFAKQARGDTGCARSNINRFYAHDNEGESGTDEDNSNSTAESSVPLAVDPLQFD